MVWKQTSDFKKCRPFFELFSCLSHISLNPYYSPNLTHSSKIGCHTLIFQTKCMHFLFSPPELFASPISAPVIQSLQHYFNCEVSCSAELYESHDSSGKWQDAFCTTVAQFPVETRSVPHRLSTTSRQMSWELITPGRAYM